MSGLAVTYPDVEIQAKEDLKAALADEDCTVGIGLPDDWTNASDPHVQVALDGTPGGLHPVAQRSTIRVTVWGQQYEPSEAKRLALLAHGLLLAHGDYQPLTGLLVTEDPDHRAPLASFTVRATVRSTPIT